MSQGICWRRMGGRRSEIRLKITITLFQKSQKCVCRTATHSNLLNAIDLNSDGIFFIKVKIFQQEWIDLHFKNSNCLMDSNEIEVLIKKIEEDLATVEETKSMNDLKDASESILMNFKKLEFHYSELTGNLRWNDINEIAKSCNKIKRVRNYNSSHAMDVFMSGSKILNNIKKEIRPKSNRRWHFIGALAFPWFIPVVKFLLGYFNKVTLYGDDETLLYSLLEFDMLLAFVMYQWLVVFTTRTLIRKSLVIGVAILSMILFLLPDSTQHYWLFIGFYKKMTMFALTGVAFTVHCYDAWRSHVLKFRSFSYF